MKIIRAEWSNERILAYQSSRFQNLQERELDSRSNSHTSIKSTKEPYQLNEIESYALLGNLEKIVELRDLGHTWVC